MKLQNTLDLIKDNFAGFTFKERQQVAKIARCLSEEQTFLLLKAFLHGVLSLEAIKAFSRNRLKLLLSANGMAAIKSSLINIEQFETIPIKKLTTIDLIKYSLAGFTFKECQQVVEIEKFLSEEQTFLLLEALLDCVLSLEAIQAFSKNRLKLLLSANGIAAIKSSRINIEQFETISVKKLIIITSKNGLLLLKESLISIDQIKELSPEHLKHLSSAPGVQALSKGWLIIDEEIIFSSMQLKHLLTENGMKAFSKNLISARVVEQATPLQLSILLSNAGLAALEKGWMTAKQAIRMPGEWLKAIINPKLASQTILKRKLADYVEIQGNIKLANALRNKGFCYGLSICDATMRVLGKLPWWESAISAILNWDGNTNVLETKLFLSCAEKPQTLANIIERVVHYIAFYQTEIGNLNILKSFAQSTLLKAKGHYEVLDGKTIKKIQDRKNVIGKFSIDNLVELLNESIFTNKLCIVSSENHACSLSYDKKLKVWNFYNPNYKSGKAKPFASKRALAKEMISCLGSYINLKIASFDSTISLDLDSIYLRIIKNNPLQFVNTETMYMLVKHRPRVLLILLKIIKTKDNALEKFVSCLTDKGGRFFSPLDILIMSSDIGTIRRLLGTLIRVNKGLKIDTPTDRFNLLDRALYFNKSKGIQSILLMLTPLLTMKTISQFNKFIERDSVLNEIKKFLPDTKITLDGLDEINEILRIYTAFYDVYNYFKTAKLTAEKETCLKDFSRFIQRINNPKKTTWDIKTIKNKLSLNPIEQEMEHPYVLEMEYVEEIFNHSVTVKRGWIKWANRLSGNWVNEMMKKPLQDDEAENITPTTSKIGLFFKQPHCSEDTIRVRRSLSVSNP